MFFVIILTYFELFSIWIVAAIVLQIILHYKFK